MKHPSAEEPPKEAPTLNLSKIFRERTDSMIEVMRELKRKQKFKLSEDQDKQDKE